MRKLLILSIACLTALCAMAQTEEINAVKFVQGQTTDWYLLSTNPEVTFTDHNPVIAGKTYDLTDGVVETAFGTAPAEKITLTAADFTVTKDGDWTYDQTEKRVKVEFISVENPGPPADKVEIYYNNDKMVKPINVGTYQVYIDIRETDTYAAVTGITSDAWKFDIIDPKGAIQAIEDKKEEARQAIDSEAGDFKTVPIVQEVVEGANVDFEDVTITATNTINEATDQSTITTTKDDAISKIDEIEASAKTNIQTAIAKVVAIQHIEEVAADAEAAIDETAGKYASLQAIWEIIDLKKQEIATTKSEASHFIGVATDVEEISQLKEEAIQHIEDIKSSAKEEIQTAIQEFIALQEDAINEVEQAAATAKEEIDGLGVDESAKSEAKAEIDNIVNTAKQTINAATSKDAIDKAKTEAIAKIHDVVQTTKNMWVTVREGMTVNYYGTLCWKYNLTAIEGAELYTVAGIENNRIILEEVLVEETQAGAGYVILATAETLRVKNGLEYAQYPVHADECNGLQGTFEEIADGAAGTAGNQLEGNYIIYNNEWRKCGGYTGLHAYSAYLIMNYVPGIVSAPAPGRKYISMPLPKETPTDLNTVDGSQCTMHNGKYIINGQFIIVKDGKKINAQGIEL